MFTRKLGRSGIKVSPLGLGCWAIGGLLWIDDKAVGWAGSDDKVSLESIKRAVDLGINFFDTSDAYGTGHSENLLGKALKGIREKMIISTKFGYTYDEKTRKLTGENATPDYIRQACESSLKRLNTDYIDLYFFHLAEYPVEDSEIVRDTLEELVKEGKVRFYGWSTDDIKRAEFFAQGKHCTAVQFNFNVFEYKNALPMVKFCEKNNIAGIIRGPLAMGTLTGKYKQNSKLPSTDVRGENAPAGMKYFKEGKPNPKYLEVLEAIIEILISNGRTIAQGALAWLWGISDILVPIPGFKNIKQIEDNEEAIKHGPLSLEQVKKIEEILDNFNL